ncbi:MAG TPA: caspase family protein [Polyangiaceae bacterium]
MSAPFIRWFRAVLVALVFVLLGREAGAEQPLRLLIAVGSRAGLAEEPALKHADTDASRVRSVLVDRGGVSADDATVLAEPSRAALWAAIDRARLKAAGHKPEDVTLLFYFSGHGDREALHLGDDRVLLTELAAKLGEVPAALQIAITDACRTNREKGFVADEPFAISAMSGSQATGQVWLHASRDGEAAQESDEIQGAIFTHAWLNGLRGAADANGDARVTLEESFAFARSQTLIRSAKSSGVLQKPEAIVNLRELAPIVLTQTSEPMATLSLPMARDTHFLVYAAGVKGVLSELWGLPERRVVLAVPPGHYMVQRRLGGIGAVAQVELGAGERRELGEGDFHDSSLEALARKGESAPPDVAPPRPEPERHNEIVAGYAAGGDTRTGLVQGPRLDYALAWGHAAVTAGAGMDLAGRTTAGTSEQLVSGFGRAAIELRVPVGPGSLRLGAGARAGWLAQSLHPQAGGPTTTNGAFVGGPEVSAALRGRLGSTFFAELGAAGNVLFVRQESKVQAVSGVLGGAAVGAQF